MFSMVEGVVSGGVNKPRGGATMRAMQRRIWIYELLAVIPKPLVEKVAAGEMNCSQSSQLACHFLVQVVLLLVSAKSTAQALG